ncbi:MAG: thiamine diphosphokinase [Treponema sp.]|jgi:thiamine pyrophosphokinase|nr:thiamine diphosphokinase [Treponema sp.]
MRGILFTGGEGPGPETSRRLAEGAALIVAADSGLVAAETAGLRPDWALGDMDSLDDPRRLENYPPGRVLRQPEAKDYTDTELAFSLLTEQGCDDIWIIGGGGGRADHLFAIRSLFERDPFPTRWITAGEDMFCLAGPGKLALSRRAGELVSVFPLGGGPWKAESGGLKWPLDGLSWNRGFFGLSNEAETGDFSIRALAGRFLVIIPGPPSI